MTAVGGRLTFQPQLQERRPQGLALRVEPERSTRASPKSMFDHEIEGQQVGKLEPLDAVKTLRNAGYALGLRALDGGG